MLLGRMAARDSRPLVFLQFNELESSDKCLDDVVSERIQLCDEKAKLEILKVVNGIEIAQLKSLPK